jgi:hypothetical protein
MNNTNINVIIPIEHALVTTHPDTDRNRNTAHILTPE